MGDDLALVAAWNEALESPAWRRPLAFLTALDGIPAAVAEQLSASEVVAGLLRGLPRWWAGRLGAAAPCAGCGEQLEIDVPVDALAAAVIESAPVELDVAGHHLVVRPARPADVAAVGGRPDAAQLLLRGCLMSCDPPLEGDVPAGVAAAVDAALDGRDPLATVAFAVTCPSCGFADEPVADLAAWMWALADGRARQLLGEVHRLALAYGWSEHEALAIGPHRRAAYLELVP
jgi:hypothetical protein